VVREPRDLAAVDAGGFGASFVALLAQLGGGIYPGG
jgi:Na+/H+-translocating membrane pyrophosphatase